MNFIQYHDSRMFLLINQLPHTAFLDMVALLISGVGKFGIVWLLIAGVLFVQQEKKHHLFFLPFLIAGGMSFLVTEVMLKNLIGRVRPSMDVFGAIVVETGKLDPSFPSGHATIAFAMAYVLSSLKPAWRMYFYLLAVLIGLSRIYLGVHYPFDVVGGAVVGTAIGWVSLYHGNRLVLKAVSLVNKKKVK